MKLNPIQAPSSGPVVGAPVIVKLAPSGSLVANCVTNDAGEFTFTYLPAQQPAGEGVFDLYINAPSNVGATITVKLAPSGTLVVHCATNEAGEFTFSCVPAQQPAGEGVFDLYITAPSNSPTTSKPEKVSVTFTNKQGPTFTYLVMWNTAKAQGKGSFAVSGKSAN